VTPRELVLDLVAMGLLTKEAAVGHLTVVPMSGRNDNHAIEPAGGRALLAKEAVSSSSALANEARVYELLRARQSKFASYVPVARAFDSRRRLLVLDLIRDARTAGTDRGAGAMLGRALARLHTIDVTRRRLRAVDPPWVLSLGCPPLERLRRISSANLQMTRMIQESRPLCRAFAELAESWTASALIHNDLRWENCLLTRGRKLKLIDWELAGRGDPAWDVGTIFSNFLARWLFSMTFDRGASPALRRTAHEPLAPMRAAMRRFWRAYTESGANVSLSRAARFAGARLIQTAYERQRLSTEVTGNVVGLLQVSENMMRYPDSAASTLLGLH
jgi:thiamine kinase-like enzyme